MCFSFNKLPRTSVCLKNTHPSTFPIHTVDEKRRKSSRQFLTIEEMGPVSSDSESTDNFVTPGDG